MCGICGVYSYNPSKVKQPLLEKMSGLMVHRGPDDCGVFVDGHIGLGMRRLAIIDLSPAGHQPMSNEGKTVWIVLIWVGQRPVKQT